MSCLKVCERRNPHGGDNPNLRLAWKWVILSNSMNHTDMGFKESEWKKWGMLVGFRWQTRDLSWVICNGRLRRARTSLATGWWFTFQLSWRRSRSIRGRSECCVYPLGIEPFSSEDHHDLMDVSMHILIYHGMSLYISVDMQGIQCSPRVAVMGVLDS